MSKHCPNCRDEFRDEVTECPDCRKALVEGPAPDQDVRSEAKAVELTRTRDRFMLTRLLGMLDEAGISYQMGEGIVLSSIVGDISQPVRVLVLEDDEVAAKEIVAGLEGAALAEGAAPPGESSTE